MDKANNCRYLPGYYAQMTQLDKTNPDLHTHFVNGGFSVARCNSVVRAFAHGAMGRRIDP